MAFCINCGKHLPDGAKFCFECGAKVSTPAVAKEEQRKTVYEGDMHKCPSCGETVNSFTTICPACGHEFRGVKAQSSVHELAVRIQEIERQRAPKKTRTLKDDFFGIHGDFSKEDEQKISLIRNYAIPNTKEDILEFMILAASNIDLKLYGEEADADETGAQRAVSDAWLAKFEQAYQKVQFTFPESPEAIKVQQIYQEKKKEIDKQKHEKKKSEHTAIMMLLVMLTVLLAAGVVLVLTGNG